MTATLPDVTLTLRRTTAPARNLPAGLWVDVCDLLSAHGLDAEPAEVVAALTGVIRHTQADRGGRLLPDGRVDNDDMAPSWYCRRCRTDVYSPDAKTRHDERCVGLVDAVDG